MAEKYRILQIVNRLNIGGQVYNVAYISGYLPGPFETLLVAGNLEPGEENAAYIPESMGVNIRYIKHMHRAIHPLEDWKGYREIKAIIQEFKPHIVHTHTSKPGAIGRLAALHCRVPIVIHTYHGHVFHSYFGPLKTRILTDVERYLARRTTAIVAISEQMQHEIGDVYNVCPKDRLHLIPYGFDLDRFVERNAEMRAEFRAKYQVTDDQVAIGIVGRIVPIKNHRFFLEALSKLLKKTDKQIRAFVIGDGEDRPLVESAAQELGIDFSDGSRPTTLTFTSWIKNIEWSNAGLDVMTLTSLNEGAPVSVLEAQASALPVVTTRAGGVVDILPNGAGFVIEQGDTDGFADKLAELAENPELRRQMGQVGRDYVLDRFSYQRLCRDTADFYQKLLQEKGLWKG